MYIDIQTIKKKMFSNVRATIFIKYRKKISV